MPGGSCCPDGGWKGCAPGGKGLPGGSCRLVYCPLPDGVNRIVADAVGCPLICPVVGIVRPVRFGGAIMPGVVKPEPVKPVVVPVGGVMPVFAVEGLRM